MNKMCIFIYLLSFIVYTGIYIKYLNIHAQFHIFVPELNWKNICKNNYYSFVKYIIYCVYCI